MATPYYICPTGVKLADGSILQLAHAPAIARQTDGTDPPIYNQNSNPSAGSVESASEPYYNFAPATKAECTTTKDWTFNLANGYSIKMHRTGTISGDFGRVVLTGGIYEGSTLVSAFPAFNGAVFHTASGLVGRLGLVASYDMANPKQYSYMGIYYYAANTYGDADAYARYSGNNMYAYVSEKNLSGLPGPYDAGGSTDEGGGGGSFTLIDDTNPVPSLPSVDLADNGLFTIYNPDAADLVSLGNYLWTGLFDVDNFKKLFNDPMQAIISLGIIPGGSLSVSVTDKNLIFGHVDTGVDCKVVTSQWLEVDCGFVEIPEFWGNYLDYNPYTKLRLYLPYIGEIDLNADDVIGAYYNDTTKNIGVIYHIDVITGACVAYVTRGEGSGIGARNDVFYTAVGNVLMQIPVTGNDFKGAYSAIIGIAGAAIAGGTAAAAVKGATAGTIGAGAAVAGVSAAVSNVTSEKESVRHSGNMSGTAGLLGAQKPYIYIDRPSQAEPFNQREYTGYPSLIQHDHIGDVSGFTIMYAVRLTGIHATKAELEEIERHLLEGVFL